MVTSEIQYYFTPRVRLKHPHLPASAITEAIGREPEHMWSVGERRRTPKGEMLPGVRSDTYWTFRRYLKGERKFFVELTILLEELSKKRDLFDYFVASGGEAFIDTNLPGRFNIGDVLNRDQIKILYDSGLCLGVEVFPDS